MWRKTRDKAAASCVEMHCGGTGRWHSPAEDDFCERDWDKNGTDVGSCGPGRAVCGFRLQVQQDQGGNDDTALNGMEFKCCRGDATDCKRAWPLKRSA